MAEFSSFFKDIADDRLYTADNFAEYFRNFLTTGIKNGGTNLEVEEKTPNSMGVQVKAGKALIEGYYYSNTATFPLTIAAADSVNDRIDRIVLKLNATDAVRAINLTVKTGTPAGSPTPPSLQTDFSTSGIYEISLAQIYVAAGETEITNAEITDERLDESVCGLINSLIQVDTATFQAEWDNWFASKTDEPGGEFYDEWKAWFDGISALLPNSADLISVNTSAFTKLTQNVLQNVLEKIDTMLYLPINDYAEKTTPVGNDILLIEDSEDSFEKKKVKKSNFVPELIENITSLTVASGESITAQKVVEIINGGAKEYKTQIGNTITPATATVFGSASTSYISAVALSSTKVLVAYRDGGNSSYGTSIILNISGDAITSATATVFESASTSYISAVALSDTKVLVAYRDGGNSSYGTAIILNISDNTITPATATVFESASTEYISTVMLTSTKVLVAYMDSGNSYYGTAIILNISGDTITPATATVFESAGTYYISAVALSDTKVLVAYMDSGNGGYGTSIILNISGDTITPATATVFESAGTSYISAVALSSTKVLVAYSDGGNGGYGTSIILNTSGDAITSATATVFESASTSYISAVALSDTKVLVAYMDGGNIAYGTSIILNTSGDAITSATATVFESASTSYISAVALSDTKVLVAYMDSGYGTANLCNISSIPPSNFIGIAKESKTSGETIKVSYGDEIDGFTGLTQGTLYYIADDGTLSETVGAGHINPVAIALSATKIKWLGAGKVITA